MNDSATRDKKERELGAILEVSRVLTKSFDLQDNLTLVMKTLSSRLDMQRGSVFLLEPGTGMLRIAAAHGLTRNEREKGRYRLGEGVVGRVFETRAPMFVPDIGDEPMFLNRTGSRPVKSGISFLSIPIRLKGEALGVISVDRIYAEEHGGVDDDLRVLDIVASLIAQFVKLWEAYREAESERTTLRRELGKRYSLPNLIGESPGFQAVLKSVLKVAATDATVLVLGESGTGKELIAQSLHWQSPRSARPFVAVNCAALPDNLIETELFGCERGAFTGATARRTGRFEMARGGSIFLDEIGEIPIELQGKLLRVLQEHTFERVGSSSSIDADVRIIAATNKDLVEEIRRGKFREDLYWRLNVVPVMLPPLRERKEDIPLLAEHFVDSFNRSYGKSVSLSVEAMDALALCAWPGNIRELANTLERIIIMNETGIISPDDLPYSARRGPAGPGTYAAFGPAGGGSLRSEVVSLEKDRIINALKETGYVRQRAARALGITPRQLVYRIKKYGISCQG